MKKIIVLGSNSFAGSCYVDYLLNKNYKIYGFSRSAEPPKLLLKYKYKFILQKVPQIRILVYISVYKNVTGLCCYFEDKKWSN